MITKPTTFVVGAGASHVYGLALGNTLLEVARKLGPQTHPDAFHMLRLATAPSDVNLMFEALAAMEVFSGSSIDDFIAKGDQPKFAPIAKGLVAMVLGGQQLRFRPGSRDTPEDWLRCVAALMADGTRSPAECLAGNRVKFVTFNFDSLIENHLSALLQHYFPGRPLHRAALLEAVPVIHVHGVLPPTPPAPPREPRAGFEDADPMWVTWLTEAWRHIRVITDDGVPDVLAEAQRAVEWADLACFLGFGFNERNFKHLGFSLVAPPENRTRRVMISAIGATGRQRQWIQRCGVLAGDPQPLIGGLNDSCASLIDAHDVIR